MSVRFSQLLVAIVLAVGAFALFRTMSAYQETVVNSDLRMEGAAIAGRETGQLGQRVATIEGLAADIAMGDNGFSPRAFEQLARADMRHDPALHMVDFFNENDVHVAHIEARGPDTLSMPAKRKITSVSRDDVQAVELALFDAELSRATSVSDVPPKASAPPNSPAADGHFCIATRVVRREREIGSIVEYLDVRQLIVVDLTTKAPAAFALDDGRGRPLQTASLAMQNEPDTQTFPIPFADRVMELTLAAPPHSEANPWWFVFGWLALVLAVVLPMEAVGHMNRRVQALNEELETRVAARTQQLEESLRESRRLAVVVESAREGVMAVGASGCIRYVNDALCKELQCTQNELIDKPVDSVAGIGISQQQLASIREEISEMGFVYREMERSRADGITYIAGVTFTRHALEDTNAIIAVSRDVTDRRRIVDQLLEAKGRLERETRMRADFIATASHELRTPVTTLRTLAALLLEKLGPRDALPPDDSRLLEILDHESRRLAHLVDDLLKIAKIDAPEAALAEELIDLRSVVSAEVDEIKRFADDGPALDLHMADAPVMVRGDEEALRSVIDNLVGNARKFTPPDGRVEVRVERDDGHARLVVSDSGVGIATADMPHIFERFYRAPGTASKAPGAGLGLAIVARLVELMRGAISVASQSGRGTTITVEYPLAHVTVETGGERVVG
jgi:PAS domain S-box-containing protein